MKQPLSLPAGIFTDPALQPVDVVLLGIVAIELTRGRSRLSYEELGRQTRQSRRNTMRALKRCRDAGWLRSRPTIDDETGGPGPNEYELVWNNAVQGAGVA